MDWWPDAGEWWVAPTLDRRAAESWIRARVEPVGDIELAHERPWATVLRVPLAHGVAWFKACAPIQSFEPRLTTDLFARWPDRVAEVLAIDDERAWLLLGDAGIQIRQIGNPPQKWLALLPLYAELQRGEAQYAHEHLVHGVPDLRLETLTARFEDLLARDLPLESGEVRRLHELAPRFGQLCGELAAYEFPATIQHDDLHMNNVFADREQLRVLDWGDSSISHPFASLVVTFRFFEEFNKLDPAHPWFVKLRDEYLEPWGSGLADAFAVAMRVGALAHTFAWVRQLDALPQDVRAEFNQTFAVVLRRAIALMTD